MSEEIRRWGDREVGRSGVAIGVGGDREWLSVLGEIGKQF
ncbi:hypothetical protein M595_2253 [Lyngbya aestuarii BL J]|uniref:Uncharacterized protein n=1 Tax=Lyngbya aestuarii BL J TaxID=1348334 RepID=U7QMU7_9CYAN|nr:hypothetical protein M595_2253 [Lyngbya aestuarii BL J]